MMSTAHRAKRQVMPQDTYPQTDEQCGKRARALTARGSISKAVQGLVEGSAAGSAENRKLWTAALIPRSREPSSAQFLNESSYVQSRRPSSP